MTVFPSNGTQSDPTVQPVPASVVEQVDAADITLSNPKRAVIALGAWYTSRLRPVYQAWATIRVESEEPAISSLSGLPQQVWGESPIYTEMEVLQSRALASRTVLVVDDILDHGTTLRALSTELTRVGVAEQLHAVLVAKNLADASSRPHVDAVGLTVEDVYVFGSGMEYRGYWRALAGIYAATEQPTQ